MEGEDGRALFDPNDVPDVDVLEESFESWSKKKPVEFACDLHEYLPQIAQRLSPLATAGSALLGDDAVRLARTRLDVLFIRKALSVESDPPIDDVIQAGVVPHLVAVGEWAVVDDRDPKLTFEAAWALSNVASGMSNHTAIVADADAVPLLLKMLSSSSQDVVEQGCWGLGNIAGDSAALRDHVLSRNAAEILAQVMCRTDNSLGTQRNSVWCASNLMRSKPPPALETVMPLVSVMTAMLCHPDDEVVMDAAWGLSYFSEKYAREAFTTGCAPRMIELMAAPTASMVTPALRTVGNFLTGSDAMTQAVIDAGILERMHFLLSHTKRGIRKEAAWSVSNITAGPAEHIQAVLDSGVMPSLVNAMADSAYEVRKEAVWAIANLSCGATDIQLDVLMPDNGLMNGLIDALRVHDHRIVAVALEAFQNIVENRDGGSYRNPRVEWMRRQRAKDTNQTVPDLLLSEVLPPLASHTNDQVANRATELADTLELTS